MILSDDARTLWDAACRLNRAARQEVSHLPPLLFFTDPERTPEPWVTAARLPPGAGVVYRHFGAEDAHEVAARLRAVTLKAGVRLLIGLDGDLARRVSADGVHLPERERMRATALRASYPDWLLTGTAHDPRGRGQAEAALDALVLSPVFPAGGASGSRPALGVDQVKACAARTGLPVYALGGIDVDSVGMLADSGACGLAGVDAIQRAFAP